MKPIITIPEADLVAILGEDGERWVQGAWEEEGSVCLHGAIRRCQPLPGDAYLIEQVAHLRGWGTGWNDDRATSWPMVRARLAQVEITDVDLADTFGPQWAQIVALVRRAAVLTADEAQRLSDTWAAFDCYDASWAVSDAARYAPRDIASPSRAARAAAKTAAPAQRYAGSAAGTAAEALAARDLIGQHGFTQDHYDLLTGPWRTVIGPIHPDDTEVQS